MIGLKSLSDLGSDRVVSISRSQYRDLNLTIEIRDTNFNVPGFILRDQGDMSIDCRKSVCLVVQENATHA